MDYSEMTAEQLICRDTLEDIMMVEDDVDRSEEIAKATLQAKKLGVSREFNRILKAHESAAKKQSRQQHADITEYPDIIVDGVRYPQMNCGTWMAGADGVYCYMNNQRMQACSHPILPIRKLNNAESKTYKTEIAFFRRGHWRSIVVDTSLISSKAKIVALSDYDVAVTSENAGLLVRFLSDVEAMNEVEVKRSTSRLGWHGTEFVPYCKESIAFDNESAFTDLYRAIGARGSETIWLDAVRRVRAAGRSEPRFMMAASFASILVELCNVLPFIVNLYGETEGGKTVTSKLCTSIWADPADAKYWISFENTDTSMETRLNFLNNLPLIMDDSAKIPVFFDISKFTYMVCNGTGKGRSNQQLGNRATMHWRNATLTNGEQPLTDSDMKAGAMNRILDFECGRERIYGDYAPELCDVLHENYGFAGKRFVEVCQTLGKQAIKEMYLDVLDEVRKATTDKMDKQTASLALILTADRLTEQHIFRDGVTLKIDEVSHVLVSRAAISENERCYEKLLTLFEVNMINFTVVTLVDGTVKYPAQRWGMIDGEYVYLISGLLEKLVKDSGGKLKTFVQWLDFNDLIDYDKYDKERRKTVQSKLPDGRNARLYKILNRHFAQEQGQIFIGNYEQERI